MRAPPRGSGELKLIKEERNTGCVSGFSRGFVRENEAVHILICEEGYMEHPALNPCRRFQRLGELIFRYENI